MQNKKMHPVFAEKIKYILHLQDVFEKHVPEGTRTPDLLVRSQSLYPAELQAHLLNK